MSINKTRCERLGYEYKNIFDCVLSIIHHGFAKDFINEETLHKLEELDFGLYNGDYEIIKFERDYPYVLEDNLEEKLINKIEEQTLEIQRLNNIIDELEKWINKNKQYQIISERCIVWEDKLIDKLKELKEGK